MRRVSKVLATLLSFAMILSVCGMFTVFAEGEYTVKYGTNNMIRVELSEGNRAFSAGTARTFTVEVPEDGTYYAIINKEKNAEGKFDKGFTVTLAAAQENAEPQSYDYSLYTKKGNETLAAPIERIGNNTAMNYDLKAGTCTLSFTSEQDISLSYIELRDTGLKIDGTKQVISALDFVGGSLNAEHVNEQLNYGAGSRTYPADYTLIGDYLADTFDQSTTDAARKVRYVHVNAGCSADYTLDVQTPGFYKVSALMNLYTGTYPNTTALDVKVDDAKVSTLTYVKESKETSDAVASSRAVYLTAGEHKLTFANSSKCGAYLYYVTMEPTEATRVVKADDNFTRIEFAKRSDAATLNTTDGLSYTTALDLSAGTYAVFVKKPLAYFGTENTYDVTLAESNQYVAAATNTDNKKSGFAYERVGDSQGLTFEVANDGTTDFTFTVSNDCDVEYIDIRRLDLPLTGEKQAIAVADFVSVSGLSAAHCSQQFGTGGPAHVLADYALIGNYFSDKLSAPSNKYHPIHLSNGATVDYNVNVVNPGWYSFGVVINTYKSNGLLTLKADGSVVDAVTYSYISDPQQDLVYTYNAVYLEAGEHTISLNASVGGIYLYRFTTELLAGDPTYEFNGGAMTVMQNGMSSTAAAVGDYRVLNAGNTATFKVNNLYTDPAGKNEYILKLAVDNAAAADATVNVAIGDNVYENLAVGVTGEVNCGVVSLPEGESAVTITSNTDGVKVKSLSIIEGAIITNATGNTSLPANRATDISVGASIDATGKATFTAEQYIEYNVNITEEGVYTLRMNAKSPQTGFTVYVDGEDRTDAQYLDTASANVSDAKTRTQDKNAATNLVLDKGAHTIKLVFHDVAEEAVTHEVNEIFLRRVDKTVSASAPIQLGAWDYTQNNLPNYWGLPSQAHQGSVFKGDELYRNVVFMGNVQMTYTFNVADAGLYKVLTYGTAPVGSTQTTSYAVDGGAKTTDTTFTYNGNNEAVANQYNDFVYLEKGQHTITLYASNPTEQAVRLNCVELSWCQGYTEVAYEEATRVVTFFSNNVNVAENATVYVALYKGNKMIGIAGETVTAEDKSVSILANTRVAPDQVKVFTLTDDLKPLTHAQTYTGEQIVVK